MAKKKITCSIAAVIALISGGFVVDSDQLKISPQGLEITGNAEGCRLDPYRCPSGLITNGVGNTVDVPDENISIEQVAHDWVRNLGKAESCLFSAMPNDAMTQGQHDAFTSFIFNTGCTRFRLNRDGSETRIYKKIKLGQYNAACHELKYWVYGGGVKLPGLVERRRREMEICLDEPITRTN